VGVNGSTCVRLRAPADGSDRTTSGSVRLFSARSTEATKAFGKYVVIGFE
jgi:hypothetical protein